MKSKDDDNNNNFLYFYICNKTRNLSKRAYNVEEYNSLINYLILGNADDSNDPNVLEVEIRLFPTILTEEIRNFINKSGKTNIYELFSLYEKKCSSQHVGELPSCIINSPMFKQIKVEGGDRNLKIKKVSGRKNKKGGDRNPFRMMRFLFSCMADTEMTRSNVVVPTTNYFNATFESIPIIINVDTSVSIGDSIEDNVGVISMVDRNDNSQIIFYNDIESIDTEFIDAEYNLPPPTFLIQPDGKILIAKEILPPGPLTLHTNYKHINCIECKQPPNPYSYNKLENTITVIQGIIPGDFVLQVQIPIDISKYYSTFTHKPFFIYILLMSSLSDKTKSVFLKFSKFPVISDALYYTTQTIYALEYNNSNPHHDAFLREYYNSKKEFKYHVFSKYYNDTPIEHIDGRPPNTSEFDINFKFQQLQQNKFMKMNYVIGKGTPNSAIPILTKYMNRNLDLNLLNNFSGLNIGIQGGKSSSRAIKEYITILGRKRLIHKQGRSKFIKYLGTLIKVKDAKALENKKKKNKK